MVRRAAELSLLHLAPNACVSQTSTEEFRGSPLLTFDVYDEASQNTFPQTGLLGSLLEVNGDDVAPIEDNRIYLNTNSVWSGVVCGNRESVASTVATILENCFIKDERIGELQDVPVGVVFYANPKTKSSEILPCEAAYLGNLRDPVNAGGVPVTVLVSPSNIVDMKQVYSNLPNVTVAPLYLCEDDISAQGLLSLMSSKSSRIRGFYADVVFKTLRNMVGNRFDLQNILRQVDTCSLLPDERLTLNAILDLLERFLRHWTPENDFKNFFQPGKIVIVDITDPKLDASYCDFVFDAVLDTFVKQEFQGKKKIVVIDQAQEYLKIDSHLTGSLFKVISKQANLGISTIISTRQTRVVHPVIIDFASFVCVHQAETRFTACILQSYLSPKFNLRVDAKDWSDQIMRLSPDEAMVYCTSATVMKLPTDRIEPCVSPALFSRRVAAPLGPGYLKIRLRKRITACRPSSPGHALEPEEGFVIVPDIAQASTSENSGYTNSTEPLLSTLPESTIVASSGPIALSGSAANDDNPSKEAEIRAFGPLLVRLYNTLKDKKGKREEYEPLISYAKLRQGRKSVRDAREALGLGNAELPTVVAVGVRCGLLQVSKTDAKVVGLTRAGVLEAVKLVNAANV